MRIKVMWYEDIFDGSQEFLITSKWRFYSKEVISKLSRMKRWKNV
jgi:hypothetical protein